MTEHELPSWYNWQAAGHQEWTMPIDPPSLDSPAVRYAIDAAHRQLMAEAAERIGQLAGASSWAMHPGSPDAPDDGICTVTRCMSRCVNTRSWHVWAGCAQEHLVEGWLCEPCLAELETDAGTHWCVTCVSYNQQLAARPEAERHPPVDVNWMIVRKEAA